MEDHSAENMYKAIELFQQATLLDPTDLHSRVEIFECYRSLYAYECISYEDFLLRSAPIVRSIGEIPESENSDAVQVMYCDLRMLEWRFKEAARHCQRALVLNPNNLKGRLRYSDLLLQVRKYHEALAQLEFLTSIDPLSTLLYTRIGRIFYWMGDFVNAKLFLNDALDLDPRSHETLALRGFVSLEVGEFDQALTDFVESNAIDSKIQVTALIGVVFAKKGELSKARQMFDQFAVEAQDLPGYITAQAYNCLVLGNTDLAFEFLEEAYERHEPDLRALNYDRRWLPLRQEPRFRRLVARVGLPDLEA